MESPTKFIHLPNSPSNLSCWLAECGQSTLRITVGSPPGPLELVHADSRPPKMVTPYCARLGDTQLHYHPDTSSFSITNSNGTTIFTLSSLQLTCKQDYIWKWEGGKAQYKIKTQENSVWDSFPHITVSNFCPQPGPDTLEASFCIETPQPATLHGLGQHEKGIFDYHGTHQYLYHTLMKTPMPFLSIGNGIGLLIDCGCLLEFQSIENRIIFRLDSVDRLELFFLLTPSMDEMIRELRRLTGDATMLPRWALGYIFSKEHFHTQKETLQTAARFRQEHIPCDCLVQDWRSWVEPFWGDKHFDQTRFPDMKQAIDTLHKENFHYMIAVWPNTFVGSSDHQEMDRADYLLGDYLTYDAFNPAARDLYARQCEEYESAGVDAWWADATEPFQDYEPSQETRLDDSVRAESIGNAHKRFLGSRRANLYSLYHCRGLYQHWSAHRPNHRPVILTRSVYPSEQSYGVIHWSGDISATWTMYREQLAELLNMNICGIPYLSEDIGGFAVHEKEPPVWCWAGSFPEGMQDPGYRELYVRWMQVGALLPIFRSHGTDTPREPWACADTPTVPFFQALLGAIQLRYRLLPYLYTLMADTAQYGDSMMRALCFDYPNDPTAANTSTQYMLGHSLLVCPVLKAFYYAPGGKQLNKPPIQSCYLPQGDDFYDWNSGHFYAGGQTITISAPIQYIPLFIKAGSILVLAAQNMQSTADFDPSIMDIHIYSGRSGSYNLYDDEGDGEAWRNGAYCRVAFHWDDQKRRFSISSREGHWTGMPETQTFNLSLFTQGETVRQTVLYDGHACSIQF